MDMVLGISKQVVRLHRELDWCIFLALYFFNTVMKMIGMDSMGLSGYRLRGFKELVMMGNEKQSRSAYIPRVLGIGRHQG